MRILIADADETFLENFQAYIWDCGYDAEITTSGLQCQAILDRCIPDVIVIERELLRSDQQGVLAKLQSRPELASIPIVVLVADSHEAWEDITDSRIVAWLEKPIQLRDSWHQIQCALGRPRTPQSANSRERVRGLLQ